MEALGNHINKNERSQKFIKAGTGENNRAGCCPRCGGAETATLWVLFKNTDPLKVTVQSNSQDVYIKILPSTTTHEITQWDMHMWGLTDLGLGFIAPTNWMCEPGKAI